MKKEESQGIKKQLVVDKSDFPLSILYNGKEYILILTKNDKLILNKYEN